jgi:hypothetical protein
MFQTLLASAPQAPPSLTRLLASVGVHGLTLLAALALTATHPSVTTRPREAAIPLMLPPLHRNEQRPAPPSPSRLPAPVPLLPVIDPPPLLLPEIRPSGPTVADLLASASQAGVPPGRRRHIAHRRDGRGVSRVQGRVGGGRPRADRGAAACTLPSGPGTRGRSGTGRAGVRGRHLGTGRASLGACSGNHPARVRGGRARSGPRQPLSTGSVARPGGPPTGPPEFPVPPGTWPLVRARQVGFVVSRLKLTLLQRGDLELVEGPLEIVHEGVPLRRRDVELAVSVRHGPPGGLLRAPGGPADHFGHEVLEARGRYPVVCLVNGGVSVQARVRHDAIDEVIHDRRDAVDTAKALIQRGDGRADSRGQLFSGGMLR